MLGRRLARTNGEVDVNVSQTPRQPISEVVSGRKRRGRRRVFNPLMTTAFVMLTAVFVGYLWYAVFSPLFDSPKDWVDRERTFRRLVHEVVTGRGMEDSAPLILPVWPDPMHDDHRRMVQCAERQVGHAVRLSTRYHAMSYPWGDLPSHLGSSPDLLVRCLRDAGIDLQQMVHVDRTNHPRRYPLHLWTQTRPDRSIDHRRLANLHAFFKTYASSLPTAADTVERCTVFQPGDIVFWAIDNSLEHPKLAGIVSDRRDSQGVPLVATLVPSERYMTDHHRINEWPIASHFRLKTGDLLENFLEQNATATLKAKPTEGG